MATDKAAQAMSYAINGESLKQKRKELKLLRLLPSSQQPKDGDDVIAFSSQQLADRPQYKSHPARSNHLIDNEPSSMAATCQDQGIADGEERVDDQLFSGSSNIRQQLTQLQMQRQRLSSINTNTSLPPISDVYPPRSDRDGLVPIQSQMLQSQQQQYHHQQLPLQNAFGKHPTSLPHTSSLESTRMLNQAQQLLQAQQLQQQSLLQSQHGLTQYNIMIQPSLLTSSLPASLLSSLSSSAAPTLPVPFFSNQGALLSGSQHVTNNVVLQNLIMQQSQLNQPDVHVHSMLGNNMQNQSKNDGRATAPQEVESLLQSQRQSELLLNPARREPTMIDLLLQQQLQQPRSFPFPLHQCQTNSQDSQTTKTNEP